MEREIKFRAWDTKKKYFLPLDDDGDYYFRDDTNGLELWDKHGKCKDAILMQFTGLKDKSGNEIYEGDWCRACFRDNEGFHYVQGRIFMDEYMWCLKAEGSVCNGEIYSINRLHDFERIGSIYENPDPLK